MFLSLMIIGLVGLVMMAIPAFARHGHAAPPGHGPALGHGHAPGHLLGQAHAAGSKAAAPLTPPPSAASTPHPTALVPSAPGKELVPADTGRAGILRLLPSPRAIFTVLALYGAFGNALLEMTPLSPLLAALIALAPALLIERLLVAPLWNLLFRFQGKPSDPLEMLIYTEARAVVPFRNGRGVVAVTREGRLVQLAARLRDDQAALPVKVGDLLQVEDVDAQRERVTVSVSRD